jgi:hypothetical protein
VPDELLVKLSGLSLLLVDVIVIPEPEPDHTPVSPVPKALADIVPAGVPGQSV